MILIDFSNIAISNFMVHHSQSKGNVSGMILRHMILNSIRKSIRQFKHTHINGGVWICCDNGSWRKDFFPLYKANRKKDEKIDWIFYKKVVDEFRQELQEYFPVRVISYPKAEADDVIATMVKTYKNRYPIMILSGDKDFLQLHNSSTKQYAPVLEKFVTVECPTKFLLEKICQGDSGDGVTNIRSDADTLVTEGKRQLPVSQKNLQDWITRKPEDFCDPKMLENWKRNKVLVDLLTCIPQEIEDGVLNLASAEFTRKIPGPGDTQRYLIKNKMVVLMEGLEDFCFDDHIDLTDSTTPASFDTL